MKAAITTIINNVSCEPTNHRGIESVYFRELLIELGFEVEMVGLKYGSAATKPFYIDYTITDFSEYDSVFFQPSTLNFMGGKLGKHHVKITNDLAKFRGKIYVLVNDPNIKIINYARELFNRFKVCEDSIDDWDRIIKNAVYLFPGKDISKFGYTNVNWKQFDWFTYIFKQLYAKRKTQSVLFENDPLWNSVYYGDNRGLFRDKQIKKYLDGNLSNLLIGYKTNMNVTVFPKMKHSILLKNIDNCKTTLIIGDEAHLDNVKTYRFYEALASNSLAAIDISYDTSRSYIHNQELRNCLYVSNKDELDELSKKYSSHLIGLQKKELKRLFEESRLNINQIL